MPSDDLPSAIALNGIAINVARAVGPVAGGILLNAASYVSGATVVYQWQRPVVDHPLPAERVLGAMRSGARYARFTPAFRAVCMRAGFFIACGSALWALRPIVGRQELGFGAFEWGIYHVAKEPTLYVEEFLVESWTEHLRQDERFTLTDRELEERVRAWHVGEARVDVTHLIYARRPSRKVKGGEHL